MEKKPYVEPQTKVVEVDDVEIICTSTGYNEGPVLFNGGSDYTFGEEDF